MKRILIFGPIGDLGGRELEVAFIAKTLSTNYFVDICTSGSFTKSSQVFEFDKNQNFFGLNSLLYRKSRIFKTLSYLSYVKNKKKGAKYDYVNNAVLKKYFNYEREIEVVLESLVLNYDAVFICAQLCSTFVDKIIKFAKKHNRKILFRTTGFISSNDYNYINDVDCFIHHSFNNANRIENNKPHTYVIIDQCAFNEEHFLKIPIEGKKITTFLTYSRMVKEKNIDIVVKAFKQVRRHNDFLYVIGEGEELNNLKKIGGDTDGVFFKGFIKNNEIANVLSKIDCVILSYFEYETGPLTGIEAMAAGKVIISAKSGAMPERIPFNPFWHNNTIDNLARQIRNVQELNSNDSKKYATQVRLKYQKEYSKNYIEKKYLDIVKKIIG